MANISPTRRNCPAIEETKSSFSLMKLQQYSVSGSIRAQASDHELNSSCEVFTTGDPPYIGEGRHVLAFLLLTR